MNKKLEKISNDIRELRVQGAISIALAADNALESVIMESKAKTRTEFLKELDTAGDILIQTRPSAVALPNAVKEFLKEVKKCSSDMPKLKKDAYAIGKKLIKNTKESIEDIGKIGAVLIDDGDVIMTHCHSSTVMSILKTAWEAGKKFEVFARETRPWGQGYITTKELSDFGIPTTLIIDNAAWTFMDQCSKVFVGADTITKDGALINKIGTAPLANVAKHFNKKFYVATEIIKLDRTRTANKIVIEERDMKEIINPTKLPKAKIRNPVFDITKAEFITSVITEKGVYGVTELFKN
jgi:ribose 1,5-bisphosphate isomerase